MNTVDTEALAGQLLQKGVNAFAAADYATAHRIFSSAMNEVPPSWQAIFRALTFAASWQFYMALQLLEATSPNSALVSVTAQLKNYIAAQAGIANLEFYFSLESRIGTLLDSNDETVSQDLTLGVKVKEALRLLYNGNLPGLTGYLEGWAKDGRPPRRLMIVLASANLAAGDTHSAHHALWEEIRYYPPGVEARHLLDRLSRLEVICTWSDPARVRPSRLIVPSMDVYSGFHLAGGIFVNARPSPQPTDETIRRLSRYRQAGSRAEEDGVKPTRKPYVVLFPGSANRCSDGWLPYTSGRALLGAVQDAIALYTDFDSTLVSCDGHIGSQGFEYVLGTLRVKCRPDVLVVSRPWWGEELVAATEARRLGIPVVVVEHGVFLMEQPTITYRREIAPADITCVWNQIDCDILRNYYGSVYPIAVTGNPEYDCLSKPIPRLPGLPDEYALYLSVGSGYQADELFDSALHLQKHIPVIAKAHPLETRMKRLEEAFTCYKEPEHLLPLIAHSSMVYGHLSSALLPAVYLNKPIFVRIEHCEDYDKKKIQLDYADSINFIEATEWEEVLKNARCFPEEKAERFCHLRDGGNSRRVVEVISALV